MGIAAALSFVLFGVCGVLHYAVMTNTHERLVRSSRGRGARLSICLYTAGFAHLVEAALYAAGFMLGQRVGIGGFAKENATSFMDTFYFSLVNFTSLGLGDIYPTGHLRLLAGVESLNGFLLITTSASFIYLLMSAGVVDD